MHIMNLLIQLIQKYAYFFGYLWLNEDKFIGIKSVKTEIFSRVNVERETQLMSRVHNLSSHVGGAVDK